MAVYDEIWDYLTDKKGTPQTQAIGILSNIAAESGGDTEALGAAGDFGIQQMAWTEEEGATAQVWEETDIDTAVGLSRG